MSGRDPVSVSDVRETPTGSLATRVLGLAVLMSLGVAALLGLVISPRDVTQGEAVRLMYVHVPVIWVAYACFITTAVSSALFLWRGSDRSDRGRHYDRLAGSAAEVGVMFTMMALVSGALWGRITWGVYWQWDARLTTTVLMFVTYLGYLALRQLPADPAIRSRRAAIVALLASVNLPLVHYSVVWWRTLHQQASLAVGKAEITGDMLATLLFSVAAFTASAVWLIVHRYRLIRLEEIRDEEGLNAAIEARRAEAMAGR